jgi:hypothetical protein
MFTSQQAGPKGPFQYSGGSARGYQPGLRVVGLQETADVRVADPYIHTPALAGQLSASAEKRAFSRRISAH